MTTFDQWYASKYYGHPWEPSKQALRGAWEAGARYEATIKAAAAELRAGPHDHDHLPEITPETIYAAYPRKVGKQAALKAIAKAVKGVGAARLLSLVKDYEKAVSTWPHDYRFPVDRRTGQRRDTVPNPATWFNQGRYDDDQSTWLPPGAPAPKSQFLSQH